MAEEKLDLFEFAATTMADPRPLLLWNMRWGSLAALEISRRRNAQRKSERQILDENLPYHSLLWLATMQQVSGSVLQPSETVTFYTLADLH